MNKYRAKPTIYNGVRYASKAEATRAAELDALVKANVIHYWIGQPTLRLGCPENVYRPDFHVVARDWGTWFEDVKGQETPKFRRDKKLWAAYGPASLRVVEVKKGVSKIRETVYPMPQHSKPLENQADGPQSTRP